MKKIIFCLGFLSIFLTTSGRSLDSNLNQKNPPFNIIPTKTTYFSRSFTIEFKDLIFKRDTSPVFDYKLAGKIVNSFGEYVSNVNVELSGESTSSLITQQDGGYCFAVPIAEDLSNLVITPSRNDNPTNGISTFDLLQIRQHILGIRLFDTPYKHLAADIDGSKSITVFDIVQLAKIILGINTEFPAGESWIFVKSDFDFQTPNPNEENYPTSIILENLNNLDFIGIKRGDINGNAVSNDFQITEVRNAHTLSIRLEDLYLQKEKTYKIIFSFPDNEPLAGFQASLKTKDLQFQAINGQTIEQETFGTYQSHSWVAKNKHHFNLNWTAIDNADNGDFELIIQAETDGYLSEKLQFSQQFFQNEAYTTDLEIVDLQLSYDQKNLSNQVLQTTIYPNPIKSSSATLQIENNQATTLYVAVYKANGQLIKNYKESISIGKCYKELELPEIRGVYWIESYTKEGNFQQLKVVKL